MRKDGPVRGAVDVINLNDERFARSAESSLRLGRCLKAMEDARLRGDVPGVKRRYADLAALIEAWGKAQRHDR